MESVGNATQDESLQAVASIPTGDGPTSMEIPPTEADDPCQYACRIIEEIPSPSHED